jgi:hypothetical protein
MVSAKGIKNPSIYLAQFSDIKPNLKVVMPNTLCIGSAGAVPATHYLGPIGKKALGLAQK